jgi:hypothetical protein
MPDDLTEGVAEWPRGLGNPAFELNEGSVRRRVTYWPSGFLRRRD